MTFLHNLLGMLVFQPAAIRVLAEERSLFRGGVCFSAGFAAFALVRNGVYASLQPDLPGANMFGSFLQLNLLQALVFFAVVYIPTVVLLSNSLSGDSVGFYVSRQEYRAHASVLFPLWGVLLLIAAPVQWLIPQFVILGGGLLGISVGLLVLLILVTVYSTWAIRELNFLSLAASIAVYVLSWFTLPIFYLLTTFLFALPLFILIPVIYLVLQRVRAFADSRTRERDLQHHLHVLTLNPQDADAHHQLGLIQLKRRNLDAAQKCFDAALKIDPHDPDYHYFLGRVFELKGDWAQALECYEETYRIKPEYGLGDIFREVGKGYLHSGKLDKAIEFLKFFLEARGSDPEGRYWLAVTLKKAGDLDGMKAQLRTILDQVRSNPRFFRKENREWLHRARLLLRQT